jgi:hypothetical protein
MAKRDGMTKEKQALKMDQASSLHHRSRRRISLRRPVTMKGRVVEMLIHPILQIVMFKM